MISKEFNYPVFLCRDVLKITKASYYRWEKKLDRKKKTYELEKIKIKEIFDKSRGSFGYDRISRIMRKEGFDISKYNVYTLMKEMNISAAKKKKSNYKAKKAHQQKISENILDMQFDVKSINTAWVGYITYVKTTEGNLYLATVLDLFSRRIVGYEVSKKIDASLVLNAFNKAYFTREPEKGLIFHSDQGSQYTSNVFLKI